MLFVHSYHHKTFSLRKNLSSVKKITAPRKQEPRGLPLAELKLFHRKKTKEAHVEEKATQEGIQASEEKHTELETRGKPKEAAIKEYNETIYSKGFAQKQPTTPSPQKTQPLRRTTWENAEIIEQHIDSMRVPQSGSTTSFTQTEIDVEKKVDFILLKKKKVDDRETL
jgi:hypothetical protein